MEAGRCVRGDHEAERIHGSATGTNGYDGSRAWGLVRALLRVFAMNSLALLRTMLGTSVILATMAACGTEADTQASTSDNLSEAECAGSADTTFCTRNAADGAEHVAACWDDASAPWKAYLAELEAARDDATHPELARCALVEKAKDAAQLRADCANRYEAGTCNALPVAVLRFSAQMRCYTESPEYKAKNDQFFVKEAQYVAAGARCVALWMKNQLLNGGCFLLQDKLSSDRGASSAHCLQKCPEPGAGGTCVPRRFQQANEPVPCGIVRETDGICDCSEDTNVCAYYNDAIERPEGFMLCPPGLIGKMCIRDRPVGAHWR